MVKRRSPRILAASALAALVVGLSACGTPQTLVPYTPAEGVNADAQRMGAPAGANEVPLKIRTLSIISEEGSSNGFLNGAIIAPMDRDDQLVSVEGRAFTSDNTPGAPIAPASTNLELPAGKMVVLSQGEPVELSSPDLKPGLVAELTLTFRDSEPQTLMVPVIDSSKADYATVTPGPAAGGDATPAATPGAPDAQPAEGQPAEGEPAPAAPATPQ
ncbi:hypothetical protein [Granulicoccus sp. GXG6511]|uniref:hypothetical protein n=1 Tax=Granulicoccus sp. GXG6511 TaxID=3381351 RepID=UPI003D7CCDBC